MGILAGLGEDAAPALEGALRSPDRQERQLAASLLRDIPGPEPSDDLLRVTVEGLEDDELPLEPVNGGADITDTCLFNARDGVAYLLQHAGQAEPFLAAAIAGSDPQARSLAARIAGYSGLQRLVPIAIPVLIEDLDWSDDGCARAKLDAAIFGFGAAAIPQLLWEQSITRGRTRDHCLIVLRNLGFLPASDRQRINRLHLLPVQRLASSPWFGDAVSRSCFRGIGETDEPPEWKPPPSTAVLASTEEPPDDAGRVDAR